MAGEDWIGKTVWLFDKNRRVYQDRRIVFRKQFVPVVITGQTSRSWLVDYQGTRRIVKATWKTRPGLGLGARVFKSQQEVDDAVFVNDNRVNIAERVRDCDDAEILRAVAAICGVSLEAVHAGAGDESTRRGSE